MYLYFGKKVGTFVGAWDRTTLKNSVPMSIYTYKHD